MTKENYNKASLILEQLEKLQTLSNRIQLDYNKYKTDKENNKHLLETLELCDNAIDVLKEIDENKFREL
jgi:hypothetical protein